MHGLFVMIVPQNLCTIHSWIAWKFWESDFLAETSAQITSTSRIERKFSSFGRISKICAWGIPPFWNSVTQILPMTTPSTCFLKDLLITHAILNEKTYKLSNVYVQFSNMVSVDR